MECDSSGYPDRKQTDSERVPPPLANRKLRPVAAVIAKALDPPPSQAAPTGVEGVGGSKTAMHSEGCGTAGPLEEASSGLTDVCYGHGSTHGSHQPMFYLCGNVCPARTGSLEGPDFPSEGRYLPYLASFQVKIAIVRQNCAKLCKLRGSPPQI